MITWGQHKVMVLSTAVPTSNNKSSMRISRPGFTLIELMVSIAIVGIIFGVIITSTLAIKRSSRDAQRQSDLRTIQSAIEQYNADQTYYPTSANLNFSTAVSLTSPGGRTYLSKIPKDPQGGGSGIDYFYTAMPSSPVCDNIAPATFCTSYCLYAKLENLSTNNFAGNCTNPPNSQYNFSLSPQS